MDEELLQKKGIFKAAEARFTSAKQINKDESILTAARVARRFGLFI